MSTTQITKIFKLDQSDLLELRSSSVNLLEFSEDRLCFSKELKERLLFRKVKQVDNSFFQLIQPIFQSREDLMSYHIKEISEDEIKQKYKMNAEIGDGATCSCFHAECLKTKADVAIKKIKKKTETSMKLAIREANILSHLHHNNIVRFVESFQTSSHIYIVLNLVEGIPLFDYMLREGPMSEEKAKKIAIPILESLDYIHHHGVAHRDIKPENILIYEEEELIEKKFHVCLIDFGTVNCITGEELNEYCDVGGMNTPCGTLGYMAPEFFSTKEYNYFVDIWAFGVLLYTMIAGIPPFVSNRQLLADSLRNPFWYYFNSDTSALKDEIISGKLDFSLPEWRHVSPDLIDFIRKLLEVNTKKRLSSQDALNHVWVIGNDTPVTPRFKSRMLDRYMLTHSA